MDFQEKIDNVIFESKELLMNMNCKINELFIEKEKIQKELNELKKTLAIMASNAQY